MRTLQVHVQVDRLPNVTVGATTFFQLGLRTSAAIVPDGADVATAGDADLILPWRWRAKPDGANGTWDPFASASWAIFQVVKGTPNTFQPVTATILTKDEAGLAHFDAAKFGKRVDDEVLAILAARGPREALEIPAQRGVISGRTAYGLVESLTSLPHPVPVGLKVWVAATFEQGGFTDDDQFVAVPVFAAGDTSYLPKDFDGTVTVVDPYVMKLEPGGTGSNRPATAHCHPSLPFKDLEIPAGNEQRMIDLEHLTIRAPKDQQFEGGDWIAEIGERVAAVIDPAARAMAVLDATIAAVVAEESADGKDSPTRAALRSDVAALHENPNSGGLFRRALDELHEPIVRPRARRSDAAPPPAAMFLEQLASRAPQLWQTAVPLLLAQAGAETMAALPPATDDTRFHATSLARVLAAAGVPPSPDLVPAGAPERVPHLDSEGELVDWLVRQWTELPAVRETVGERRFEASVRRFVRGDATTPTTVAAGLFAGVVDVGRIPRDPQNDRTIEIPIHFSKAEAPCEVTVTLETPHTARVGSSVTVELKFETTQTTVKIAGGADQITDPLTTARLLTFAIKLPKDGGEPTLEVTYGSLAPVPIADAAAILAGRVGIVMTTSSKVVAGIDLGAVVKPSIDRQRLAAQAHALRSALSWAYAAPVVPGLLQGWAPLEGKVVDESFQGDPLPVRLPKAIDKLVKVTFPAAFQEAATAAGLTGKLLELFDRIGAEAIEDAGRLAAALVPPALDVVDCVTEEALPLAFLIAQLQDFDPKEDLWGRLAGVGVLISRDGELEANRWWSLNAASLHVTRPAAEAFKFFDKDSAVQTRQPGGGTQPWKMASKVDPVPLTVADVGGVRSALIKYENQPIVAELQGAPQLDPTGQAPGPRRPEGFLFLAQDFTRLPALTFGRRYTILPYLIAHGGALPLELRAEPLNPVKLKPVDGATHTLEATFTEPGNPFVLARHLPYLRTVPVGAPRLADTQWPGTFPDVDPLADELPLRPPPITLQKGMPARFFFDQRRHLGLLSSRSAEPDAAVRIDVGEVETAVASAALLVAVHSIDPADGLLKEALAVRVKVADLVTASGAGAAAKLGLRIEADRKDSITVRGLARREHDHGDDEPRDDFDVPADASLTLAVAEWRNAFVVVESEQETFDAEPPTLRWGTRPAADGPLLLEGDRPTLPAELAHTARKVAVLDGINAGAATGPQRLELSFRRPSVSVTTYERWINRPIAPNQGTADPSRIRKTIETARNAASTLGSGDRTFDDPAVEALFVEVVRLFPTRSVDVPLTRVRMAASFDEAIAFRHPSFCKVVATVDSQVLPMAAVKASLADSTLTLTLPRGGVYEVRAYGAVPEKQLAFAAGVTAARFSPAVRSTWRRATDQAGNKWQLGTPLTLTLEVATEIMPECWPRSEAGTIHFEEPAFAIDLARPPQVVEDRANFRLVPENLGPPLLKTASTKETEALRIASVRYVNRAALLPQRWSWRGRPHPELEVEDDVHFGTAGRKVSTKLGEFVDAAFVGRDDDDVGTIREIRFSRAHAAGGLPTMGGTNTESTRPVLLEHDLDRRAGVHLWRFALRLKSRYAAMRPNSPAMLRFSHVQSTRRTQWWSLVVTDRRQPGIAPRALDRPSLMLVLPLTEPLMTAGSVPPLLAVFNQELFPLFNAADGIEAVIDVARHPLPAVDGGGNQSTKYLQEYAPDPVRTGDPAADRPVAIRVDGPVGYTFDAAVEAGRFDHAALLVSPVAEVVRPGSFMRLRFRRMETPRLLMARDPDKSADEPARAIVDVPIEGKRFLLANPAGAASKDSDPHVFPTTYEGLAFDLDLADASKSTLKLQLALPTGASTCGNEGTAIVAEIKDRKLSIQGETALGKSAAWSLPLSEDATAALRVVVSLRPKPQKPGSAATDQTYKPVGDVSVQVRISPAEHDPNRRAHDDTWLSVLCMPLTTVDEFVDRVAVRLCPGAPVTIGVTALRLSDFAPPVWCQFAASMSRFAAKGKIKNGSAFDVELPVSDLTVQLDGTTFKLGLTSLVANETLETLTLSTVDGPAETSQLEEPLYAVVTRFVHDAFDRLRERAIGIHPLDAKGAAKAQLGERIWPATAPEPYTANMRGRVRFLRVLRGKTRDKGGFELASPQFPADFFGREVDEALDADPFDAAGMAMGISAPIEWGK